MKIDWKWTIGSILAVIGIVIAIYAPEYSQQQEFNDRLQRVESSIESAKARIVTFRGIANGSNLTGYTPSSQDLTTDRDDVLSLVEDADAQMPISSPFDAELKLFTQNSDFLFANLELCPFVSDKMLIPLEILDEGYSWILEVAKNEQRKWTELFFSRDFDEEVRELPHYYSLAGVTLTSVNGC